MKKRLIKFRVVSLAMLTLLLSFLTSTAYAVDFTLQTNSSTFAKGETNSLVASQSGVTFTYLKGSSGDFANVPQSDHIRMYQGSTLTIESAASITNLKVTCTTSNYGPANITIDGNELSSGTWTGNAKNIVMTAKAQARITSIVVTLNDAEIPVKVPTITADTYFIGSTNVTLACETEGASIYYTTNGDAVTTENGNLYDGKPFPITATTTVKAIAVKDADTSFENEATFTAVDTKADLASVKDLAKGSLFGFTGDATVVADPDNTNVYIKDANSFSLIYDSKKATTLPVGSKIVPNWIAKTDVYNALVEIVPISELVAAEGEPAAVTYDEATFADVVEANVNKVVVFKNLEYTLGTGKNITFKEGEQTIAGYNKFSLTIDEPVEGKKYDVVGAISINNSTMQILPLSITRVPEVLPVSITAETGTDLTALVNAKKKEIINGGDLVGDITINLAANGSYTVSGSIEAPASLTIAGLDANAPAKINAAGLKTETISAPFIFLNGTSKLALKADGTQSDQYKYIDKVAISNVEINGLSTQLVRDNQKTLVNTLSVDNVQAEFIGSSVIFDFNGKGYPANLSVNNSTLWSKDGHTGYLLQSAGRVKDLDKDQSSFKQIVSLTNSTLYKIAVDKQLNNMNGKGQKSLELTMKSVILAECTQNGNEVRGWLGGQNSPNPTVVYENNTYWKAGAVQAGWIDATKQGADQTGTYLITDPTFVSASAGDFHVFCGSQQAKYKTGDPRWLVEYDAAQALAVPVVISPATDTDITTALNEAKQSIDNVGDITINLAANGSYTVSGSIEAPASLTIAGLDANAPAKINAAGLKTETISAPFIFLNGTSKLALKADGTQSDQYKYIDKVAISNVEINGLSTQLVRDNQKTLVNTLSVDNVQAEFIGSSVIFDFNGKGYPANLSVNNSTLWSKDGHTGYLLQSAGRVKDLDKDQSSFKQIVSLTNSTLYKIAVDKQLNNMNGKGQKSLELTMKSVILAECTQNGNEVRGWLGGQNSPNPTVVYENNTYWKAGAVQAGWIDATKQGADQTGTYLITEPAFALASDGDFTLALNTLQNKLKTGDPRWLDEFVADDVTDSKALLLAEIQNATTLLGDADVNTNADAKALKDAIDKAKGVYDTADLNEVINAAIKELQAAEAAYIATSINEVNVNADAQSGEWFTTQGVRISKPTQKGIYIHNGKKIMINNK